MPCSRGAGPPSGNEGFQYKTALKSLPKTKLEHTWRRGKLPCKCPVMPIAHIDRYLMLAQQVSPTAQNVKKHIARRIDACEAMLELHRRRGRLWWHQQQSQGQLVCAHPLAWGLGVLGPCPCNTVHLWCIQSAAHDDPWMPLAKGMADPHVMQHLHALM